MYVLFRLHSRWESSPLPPDQRLRQNITCATSSAVTAVGSFLLFHLFRRCVVLKSPLQIQCRGLVAPCNTCRHEKALHRTCCREAIHWQGETDTLPPFCSAASSLLASGGGRKRKVASNQTPTNTPCASTAIWQASSQLCIRLHCCTQNHHHSYVSGFTVIHRITITAMYQDSLSYTEPPSQLCTRLHCYTQNHHHSYVSGFTVIHRTTITAMYQASLSCTEPPSQLCIRLHCHTQNHNHSYVSGFTVVHRTTITTMYQASLSHTEPPSKLYIRFHYYTQNHHHSYISGFTVTHRTTITVIYQASLSHTEPPS